MLTMRADTCLTWFATTAKPRPELPARAASINALRARKVVSRLMSLMSEILLTASFLT
jgi:hypothetical protein